MAGIYLHIPFCKQACYYCDFHFSTSLALSQPMVDAMVREIELHQGYLNGESVDTIYFGGGTPSLLSEKQLTALLNIIYKEYEVNPDAEITLEANPDDLSLDKLKKLRYVGINRLSIGIQSFHDAHLTYLNRAHNDTEALACVGHAREVGFNNISIDLIYGIPANDHKIWEKDLIQAMELRPEHISAYCLTIEEKTVFGNWLKKGKIKNVEDEFAANQFELLLNAMNKNGYEQYEISNFALPGQYSQHNSAYWQQKKYLGIGPSAHSFNGLSRQHNIAQNAKYIKLVTTGEIPFELDHLSKEDAINEYLLTTLRTIWGANLDHIKKQHNIDLYEMRKDYIKKLIEENMVTLNDSIIVLTDKGKLLADKIATDLFVD